MALALLMAVQAAASSAPAGAVPIEFDLKTHKPAPDPEGAAACAQQSASDIVVCGRRGPGYRVPELDGRYDEKPLRAEIGIGGGTTVRAYVESVEFPNGQVSKRAMVGVKMKF